MVADLTLDRHRLTRRCFLGTAAATVAAAQLSLVSCASSNTSQGALPAITPGTHTSFASLKQINAGELNIGYADVGPTNGQPVILLHGWPYDIHSFVDVAPLLAEAHYRVIVPYLRGTSRRPSKGPPFSSARRSSTR